MALYKRTNGLGDEKINSNLKALQAGREEMQKLVESAIRRGIIPRERAEMYLFKIEKIED